MVERPLVAVQGAMRQAYSLNAMSNFSYPAMRDPVATPRWAQPSRVSSRPSAARNAWGAFPMLSLCAAIGVLLMACAMSGARYVLDWAEPVFWLALVVIYAPIVVRLLMPDVARRETVALLLVLGLALYLVKIVRSPLGMSGHDEFAHWRVADDIFKTGRLFQLNPILPVTPFYPGMEIVTTAVAQLSGLSLSTAGFIVIGAARLLMMLALFLFFEGTSGSTRVAGIAVAVYTANTGFILFDSQFSYEPLALPLAAAVIASLARRTQPGAASLFGYRLIAMAGTLAVTVTHHMTSYLLFFTLAIWALITFILSFSRDSEREPRAVLNTAMLVSFIANVTWLVFIATFSFVYLSYIFSAAFGGILSLFSGGGIQRLPFQSTGQAGAAPILERITGLGSAALLSLALPSGLWQMWRQYRHRAMAWILAAAAAALPASQVLRLTGGGWEVSNRSSAYLFWGVGILIAIQAVHWLRVQVSPGSIQTRFDVAVGQTTRALIFAGIAFGLTVVFVGGFVNGTARATRMPGPYLVGADDRSIGPEGLAAAAWMRATLGPGNTLVSDRQNMLLFGSYGEQALLGGRDTTYAGIFLQPRLQSDDLATLRRTNARYLVSDLRLSTSMPEIGFYYNSWEQSLYPYTSPVPRENLTKFETISGVQRMFDSGSIVIYDAKSVLQSVKN